jgi:hypothetical protein
MLPTSRVHFIPAGKAPQRGADAVKASYRTFAPLREPPSCNLVPTVLLVGMVETGGLPLAGRARRIRGQNGSYGCGWPSPVEHCLRSSRAGARERGKRLTVPSGSR